MYIEMTYLFYYFVKNPLLSTFLSKNYDEKYLNHFNKIVSLKNTRLPKDILNLIAGNLFI